MTRTLVIGGGISGLSAAWELVSGDHPASVVVIEGSDRLGGKIATAPFAGLDLDTGPDSFLARVPAAADLARQVGLGSSLVPPATGQAFLWARGRLRPLPSGLVLGVPTSIPALARSGVLPPWAVARAAWDLVGPGSPAGPPDVAVGALVRRRMGRGVQLGLVDALLGGINAGHTDSLSAAVAAPQLLAAAARDRSLIRGLAASAGSAVPAVSSASSGPVGSVGPVGLAASAGPVGPIGPVALGMPAAPSVFLTVEGGLSRLVDALRARISAAANIITSDPVVRLAWDGATWTAQLSSGQTVAGDSVVLACPAAAAASLLAPVSPVAAAGLASIRTASVVLTTLAYPASAVPGPVVGSGFLVPRPEGRLLTAATWVGSKWAHLDRPGQIVIRASSGRVDDGRAMAMDDDALVAALHGELTAAMGLRALRPTEARVHRWPDAFPQYEVGHLERIAAIEARLAEDAPRLVLAGAALRGVGLATCIAGARAAAARLRELCDR